MASIKRHGVAGAGPGGHKLPFAKAVEAGGFLYVSGQAALNAKGEVVGGNIEAQARQTIDNLQAVLKECGYSMEHVVKVNAWLDDPRDFAGFNRIFREYFGDHPPARSTVESAIMVDCKIEMDLVAYKDPAG